MPQSLSNVLVHIVFSTKDRQPYLSDAALHVAMHKYLSTVSAGLRCPVIQLGGVADHVHVLARQARTITLATWVRELKRSSSLWVKGLPGGPNVFTGRRIRSLFVSESQSAAVERYIARQEAHHRRLGFQDELRTLLRRHQIAYDERYVGLTTTATADSRPTPMFGASSPSPAATRRGHLSPNPEGVPHHSPGLARQRLPRATD